MNAETLRMITEGIIIPILITMTTFIVRWLNAKSTDLKNKTHNDNVNKYIGMLNETIANCVIATNQTMVNALKADNAFTDEAMKEAFNKTYDAVIAILSEDAKIYLNEVYGDLTEYITQRIEAEVNCNNNRITEVKN